MTKPRDSRSSASTADLEARLAQLAERNSQLESLLHSTHTACLWLDRDLRITLLTPTTRTLLALDASDTGRPVVAAVRDAGGVRIAADAGRALAGEDPPDQELEIAGQWYLRHCARYGPPGERATGVAVSFTDITHRKASEREIETAKIYAESIVDTLRQPLLVLTHDLRVKSANKAFYRCFHVAPGTVEGVRLYELGNGQWNIPQLRHRLEEVLAEDNRFEDFEVALDFEQIGRRTMLLNARRLDHAQLILLAIEDVTDRERARQKLQSSEARFRALVETMAQAVWETDAEGAVVADSPSWRAYTGQTREQSLGFGWLAAVHRDDRARAEHEWRTAVAAGHDVDAEFRLKGPNDSWRWTNFRAAPIRAADGRILKWVGMNLDVSQRKQAEVERELLAQELSHRVKNAFAVVQALAMQTGRDATSAEAMREAFLGRLKALSQAHCLLLDADWQNAPIRRLVDTALLAYTTDHPDLITVRGPDVSVTAKQSLGLALVLHELGTNAAKYGALSRSDGRVAVDWQMDATGSDCGRLRLEWREHHDATVVPPRHKGFGTKLIEQACRYELDGDVTIDYGPQGLVCRISFPLASRA